MSTITDTAVAAAHRGAECRLANLEPDRSTGEFALGRIAAELYKRLHRSITAQALASDPMNIEKGLPAA